MDKIKSRCPTSLRTASLVAALCLAVVVEAQQPPASGARTYDVRAYGAVGDGKTLDSPAINRAIEACAHAGGGTVSVPAGTYLSGSLHMKSDIHLFLDAGAVILGRNVITENLTIVNCQVSGFQEGTLLDGTRKPRRNGTGRIKFGTEANGGFRNVTVSNCTFRSCRGLALEEVDGVWR